MGIARHLVIPILIVIMSISIVYAEIYEARYELSGWYTEPGIGELWIYEVSKYRYGYVNLDENLSIVEVSGEFYFDVIKPGLDANGYVHFWFANTLFFIVFENYTDYIVLSMYSGSTDIFSVTYLYPVISLEHWRYIPNTASKNLLNRIQIGINTSNYIDSWLYLNKSGDVETWMFKYYLKLTRINSSSIDIDFRIYDKNGIRYLAIGVWNISFSNVVFSGVGAGWFDVYLVNGKLFYDLPEYVYQDFSNKYSYPSNLPPKNISIVNNVLYVNVNGVEIDYTNVDVDVSNWISFMMTIFIPLMLLPLFIARYRVFLVIIVSIVYTILYVYIGGYNPLLVFIVLGIALFTEIMSSDDGGGGEL